MVVLTKHFGDNIEARRWAVWAAGSNAVWPWPRFQLIPNMWDELVCGGRPRDEIKYQHFVSGDNFILAGAASACQPVSGLAAVTVQWTNVTRSQIRSN